MIKLLASSAAAFIMSLTAPNGDQIPDFSRVGYRWGDKEIPKVKVVKTIEAPADGADATKLIQGAIDATKAGAILLKAGTYNVGGEIKLNKSGIVLRGEGDKTVIVCTGNRQRTLLTMGLNTKRQIDRKCSADITEKYVPFGRLYVEVDHPENFSVGDRVVLFRPSTAEWLHDIKMDQIDQHFDTYGIVVRQWTPGSMNLYYERIISKIQGYKLWFDNPVVMSMDEKYGGGKVMACSWERISESGIEDIKFVSEFDSSKTSTTWWHGKRETYLSDEQHGWVAVKILCAEHCWIRNVTAEHFGYSTVWCATGSKNISVLDCRTLTPVSKLHGSRRYAYAIAPGQCCLVKDCHADHDRHGFVLNGTTCGPNVYTHGTMTHTHSDIGPHNRYATGGLYDCIITDGGADVQDRGGSGHGHGWAGANMVFWNCEAESYIVQGLWTSATNYAIGCIGKKSAGWYGQGSHAEWEKKGGYPKWLAIHEYEERPDGVWVSHGKHVEPASLYDYQLKLRKSKKILAVPAKCYK